MGPLSHLLLRRVHTRARTLAHWGSRREREELEAALSSASLATSSSASSPSSSPSSAMSSSSSTAAPSSPHSSQFAEHLAELTSRKTQVDARLAELLSKTPPGDGGSSLNELADLAPVVEERLRNPPGGLVWKAKTLVGLASQAAIMDPALPLRELWTSEQRDRMYDLPFGEGFRPDAYELLEEDVW